MFERAVIRGVGGYPGVDLGLVAETLLFYREVHLAFDQTSLREFIRFAGIIPTLELLNRKGVSASFTPENVVVNSDSRGGLQWHDFAQVSLIRTADGRKVSSGDLLVKAISEGSGLPLSAKRVELVRRKIKVANLPSDGASIPRAARTLLADKQLVHDLPRSVLAEICPDYELPIPYKFEVVDSVSGFLVRTDISFAEVNRTYHQAVPPSHSTITEAYILAHLIGARCDAYFAASRLAELVTTPVHASLVRQQVVGLMKKRDDSVEQYDLFEDVALPEGRSIREAVNAGARTFSEFLVLLDKAERFREWLHSAEPDARVVREYLRESTANTWMHALPAKMFRFGFVTIAGSIVNPAVGVGLGAFDAFILEPLSKGWRPNQFITGPLARFVKS